MDTAELAGLMKAWHGIYDPANEDAITNVECLLWINMARRSLCRGPKLRFSEFENHEDTTASKRAYELPAGWMSFSDLYYLDDNDSRKPLEWFSNIKRFYRRFPDRTLEGTVVGAVQWGNEMVLGLVPSEEVRIFRAGHKLPADLSWDATDDLLDELWENIMWVALVTSGEYHTVPASKHAEWKSRAFEDTTNNRVLYRTAKTPPGRIVTSSPGTITPVFEED